MTIRAVFRIRRGGFTLDADLSLPSSGVTAVFGPSGSGKTTLLRAMAGLEKADAGYLAVGDMVWQDGRQFVPPHRRAVGYVFQEPSLFEHLDVRRNIAYGRRRAGAEAQKVAVDNLTDILEIGHLLDRHPHQLSGGEQQRVAIARALAAGPMVLLMDEPLASLDARLKKEILPYLDALHRSLAIPVIYVSHSIGEVVRLADHLVLLDQGRVCDAGDVADVFNRRGVAPIKDGEPCSVIEGRVGEHDEFGMTRIDAGAASLLVGRIDAPGGTSVRLLVRAADVSLTLNKAESTSILNVIPAVIRSVEPYGGYQAMIRLDCGGIEISSLISRRSVENLSVTPGQHLYAQVKSAALCEPE